MDDDGVVVPDGAQLAATVSGQSGRQNKYQYGFTLGTGAQLAVDFCSGEQGAVHAESGEALIRSRTAPADFVFAAQGGAATLTKLGSKCPGLVLVVE